MRPFLRLALPVLALGAAALLVGCGGNDATTPVRDALTLQMRGVAPHVGDDLHVRIVHVATGVEVARTSVRPVAGSDFDAVVDEVLVTGETYNVDFYADYNRDFDYDAPPADHAWRRTIVAQPGGTTVNFVHDTAFTDIRWPD